ncbi:MAG: hypothetical protein ABEH40_09560 [Haloferacaceae archaeon]
MADDAGDHGHEGGDDHGHDDHHDHAGDDEDLRVTSPMQEFTTGQVGIGFAVLLVGLAVTFGVPLLLG